MDQLNIEIEDLDILLDPYISKDDLLKKWKDYLQKNDIKTDTKMIQLLAKKICEKYKVNPSSIRALFRILPFIPKDENKKWVLNKEYTIPLPKELDLFDDEKMITSDLKKRITFPSDTDIKHTGPINSDHNATHWCHIETKDDAVNCYHGMITCECHEYLPENVEDLKCDMCLSNFNLDDMVRFPYINDDGDGGWFKTYCSYSCLKSDCFINDVREQILCDIYFDESI